MIKNLKRVQSCCRCWFCPWRKVIWSCHGSVLQPFANILDRLNLYNSGLTPLSLIIDSCQLPVFTPTHCSPGNPFLSSTPSSYQYLPIHLLSVQSDTCMFQINFKFQALHSATAPSTFLTTPEATELGRNSGRCVNIHWNSVSRSRVCACIKGTQRLKKYIHLQSESHQHLRSRHENRVWVFYRYIHTHNFNKKTWQRNIYRGYAGMLILTRSKVEWT